MSAADSCLVLYSRVSPHPEEDLGSIHGPWTFFVLIVIWPDTEFFKVDITETKKKILTIFHANIHGLIYYIIFLS